jgi:hypothetical protein
MIVFFIMFSPKILPLQNVSQGITFPLWRKRSAVQSPLTCSHNALTKDGTDEKFLDVSDLESAAERILVPQPLFAIDRNSPKRYGLPRT